MNRWKPREYEEEEKEQEAPSSVTGHWNESNAELILSESITSVFIHIYPRKMQKG
jgi:hypothetical protein